MHRDGDETSHQAPVNVSEECGTLQEAFFVCLVTLECIEVGNGGECDEELDAAGLACM